MFAAASLIRFFPIDGADSDNLVDAVDGPDGIRVIVGFWMPT
jgi:hypothetical protein